MRNKCIEIILIICSIVFLTSCKEQTKKITPPSIIKINKRNVEEFLIFGNPLTKNDIENAEYSNINFENEGAVFTRDREKPTYIKIPFSNLDFAKSFNVSFTFKTTFDDGNFPQSFLAFTNNNSTTFQIPLYIYLPANKITGVYGNQLMYYENFNRMNKSSLPVINSFKIEKNIPYFVSINYTNIDTIEIYVNSDLYATYEGLKKHNLKSTHLIVGSMIQNEEPILPFEGTIYGVKIFNKSLEESEIVKLFNDQPLFFEFY